MTADRDSMPIDWDTLVDPSADGSESDGAPAPDGGCSRPPLLTLMASSWADLVALLALCAGALITVLVMGERPSLPALWWAAALALLWWVFAAATLVVVRHGTPGMLLAGICFDDAVKPDRVPWVLAAALFGVATLGLSGLGGEHAALRAAAATDIKSVDSPA
jgi:hypothetical protein